MASYVAHQHFKPISDDYHQNKQASHGAGKITQTAIEQQWENQLINDANFTANTQLPSVTFDVNNSYVAQQLGQRVGEEVSHFYHPTPPPRNPNGFWRGVDDVLEMQEGTRKAADLIFTGNYEAPKNRWQKAGYDIGVPLAIGAEFVMAGERLGVGAVEAIENVYQGSQRVFGSVVSKLERWGLFGRTEEATEFNYKFKSGLDVIHFEKHGMQIANKFDLGRDYDVKQYIEDANFVIKNGIYVPELNAYVRIPVDTGTARAPFVGLDRFTNEITTFHLKPITYLEQRAPSLGWSTKPSFEINEFLDLKQNPDWISLNTRTTP